MLLSSAQDCSCCPLCCLYLDTELQTRALNMARSPSFRFHLAAKIKCFRQFVPQKCESAKFESSGAGLFKTSEDDLQLLHSQKITKCQLISLQNNHLINRQLIQYVAHAAASLTFFFFFLPWRSLHFHSGIDYNQHPECNMVYSYQATRPQKNINCLYSIRMSLFATFNFSPSGSIYRTAPINRSIHVPSLH